MNVVGESVLSAAIQAIGDDLKPDAAPSASGGAN